MTYTVVCTCDQIELVNETARLLRRYRVGLWSTTGNILNDIICGQTSNVIGQTAREHCWMFNRTLLII